MSDNRMICVNGHYYDGSKYEKCPHCAEGMARVEPSVFSTTSTKSKETEDAGHKKGIKIGGLFKKKTEEVNTEVPKSAPIKESVEVMPVQQRVEDANHNLTRGLQSVPYTTAKEEPVDRTMLLSNEPDIVHTNVTEPKRDVTGTVPSQPTTSQPVMAQSAMVQSVQPVMAQPMVPQQNLSAAFAEAITPQNKEIDKNKTMSFFSTAGNTEPPVGYLICTAGEDFGTGFLLKSGNNTIGRGQSMDVIIMDPKVSREKQAFVMYDPVSRKFFLKPGEGSGLCYINGQVVLMPMELKPFEKLKVGDTELMLIAVCCEQFSWDDCK